MVFRTFGAGMVFLLVAIVAALFGFGVVSDDDPLAAKLCAVFFLLAAVAAFGWGWMNRSREVIRPARPGTGGAHDEQVMAAQPATRERHGPERTMAWSYRPSTEIRV